MSDEDENDLQKNLARASRIEARQFHRLFETQDGKAVLEALKRDFGWDAAAPPLGKDEKHPSAAAIRAWTGARSVIATILHKSALGGKLDIEP